MELSTIFINISLALTVLTLVFAYIMLKKHYRLQQLNLELKSAIHENKKIHHLLDHSDTVIYTHDLNGKIEYANATVQQLLGLNPGQLFGSSFKTLIQQDHPQIWENYIQAIFRDHHYHCELKLLDSNGHSIPFQIQATGIIEEGVVVAVKGHARVLIANEKSKKNVDSINKVKISAPPHQVFAHHIKNIFTAIFGFVEIIEEKRHKSDSLDLVCKEIRSASHKGVKLVADYLTDPGVEQDMEAVKPSKMSRNKPKRKSGIRMGQGRILYVDDEESLLKMYSKFIRKLGYEVDTCASGINALEEIDGATEPYGLIISDWMMPGLSGAELVKKIQEKQPNIPIVLLSGKNIPEEERPIVHTILEKPVDPVLLSEKIYELLNNELNP